MAYVQRIFNTDDKFLLNEGVALDIFRGMFFEYLSSNNLDNDGDSISCNISVTYYTEEGDIFIELRSGSDNKNIPKRTLVHSMVDCCKEWECYVYHDILEDYKGIGSINQWFRHNYKDIVSKFKELYSSLN